MRARHWRFASLVIATAALGGAAIGPAPALARSPRQVRVGSAPRQPADSRAIGSLAGGTRMSVLVALKPSDPAGLAAYAQAVSTPGSSVYHQFLTVAEFRQRFGPTQAQIQEVESGLQAAGLRPGAVSANGLLIPIAGHASGFGHAFATSFRRIRLRSGRTAFANTSAPQFPASVSGYIRGVIGLDSLSVPQPQGLARASRAVASAPAVRAHVVTGGPQPCGAAGTGNTADKIASAYGFSTLYGANDEGAGQTIALIELEPNLTSDINAYTSCYGIQTPDTSVNYIPVDGGPGSGAGSDEAALDIEQVVGLAPQATIDVYRTQNFDQNLIDDYAAAVDNPAVDVVSTSWGTCEPQASSTVVQAESTLFAQAATEGKSVYASTGDNGSTDCGTSALAVDDPASQPFVTGVGGTRLSNYLNPAAQTVWNGSSGASGGGISTLSAMPSYQSSAPQSLNVIQSGVSSNTPCGAPSGSYCREVPDVSANADPNTGYPMVFNGTWELLGGTSAAAPLWAAYTALINGSGLCGGAPIGFANPLLYAAAAGSSYSTEFDDVSSGNNNYFTDSGTHTGPYSAGAGYDMASGLGTPIGGSQTPTLPTTLCNEADRVAVTNPGSQQSYYDVHTNLAIVASDSEHHTLTYSATGLPQGLSINQFTGAISGTPAATISTPATVTVTVSDPTTGASTSVSFSWAIPANPSCAPANPNLLINPGFESGTTGWKATPNVIVANAGTESGHSGAHFAWLDGYSTPHTDTLSQTVTLPLGCTYALTYYQAIDTTESSSSAVDTLTAQILSPSGTALDTLTPVSNLNWTGTSASATAAYFPVTVNSQTLTPILAGQQTVTLKFTATGANGGGTTDFLLDDVALNVSPAP